MVDTTRRLLGSALWTGGGYARAHYTRVVDPDIVRCLDVGQAAYIYRGGVTYLQVKRLAAGAAELPGPAPLRPPARPQLPAAPAGPPATPAPGGADATATAGTAARCRAPARRGLRPESPDDTRHGCRWMAHRSGHKPCGVPSTGPAGQPGLAGPVRGGSDDDRISGTDECSASIA